MHPSRFMPFTILAFAFALLAGCATRNKIDWNTRIGSYTYDEAVVDLGPPDKSETISDGTKVCEWLVNRTSSPGTVIMMGGGYYGRTSIGTAYGVDQIEWYLRLIFDNEGVLKDFREVRK